MRFFETIKAQDGRVFHIDYHNARLNQTIFENFGIPSSIDLASHLIPPQQGLYRCKVIYSSKIERIEYHPYEFRPIQTFELVEAVIDYSYKYLDRRAIEVLLKKADAQEIIILKKGLITDTSKANIALLIDGCWLTPKTPLLPGTTRARLLEAGAIEEADLDVEALRSSQKIALMNAMINFYEINDFEVKG